MSIGSRRRWLYLSMVLIIMLIPILASCGAGEETATPTATLAPTGVATPPPGAVIKIGVITDLTGPAAAWLGGIQNGIVDYWRYVNEVKGGINGIPVQLITADTRYDPGLIMTEYDRLAGENVDVIITGMSLATDMLRDKVAEDKIPCLTNTGGIHAFDTPGWVFGACAAHFADQTAGGADWIVENWKEDRPVKIAYLFSDTTHGRACTSSIPYAESIGAEVVAEEYFASTATDMSPQLMRIRDADPDWIITHGLTNELPVLLPGMNALGMLGGHIKVLTMALDNIGDVAVYVPQVAPLLNGLYGSTFHSLASLSYTKPCPGHDFALELYRMYRDPNAQQWKGMYHSHFAVNMVIEEAIKRALDKVGYNNLTGQAIKDALETIKDYTAMGIVPPITYTADNHTGDHMYQIWQWTNGSFTQLTDYIEMPTIIQE